MPSHSQPLDYNQKFFLELVYDEKGGELRGELAARFHSSGKFERNLSEQSLRIEVGEQRLRLKKDGAGKYSFNTPVTPPANLRIILGNEVYGEYNITEESILGNVTNQLIVFETRSIAEYNAKPYTRAGQEHIILPTTDTHTHISGQGSYATLVKKHGNEIYFPVRLLEEFEIEIPDDAQPIQIDRVRFPPIDKGNDIPLKEAGVALGKFSQESKGRLLELMAVPVDEIHFGFSKLELASYQLRAPFKKFIKQMLGEIAEESQQQGLKYLEISVSGMNKEFLLMAETLMPELESQFGVKIRFLYSIPRSLPKEMIHDHIEHLKVLAQSPYLVGADIIGYEAGKNTEIKEELDRLFAWAGQNNTDFIIAMHSGETEKNQNNVNAFLTIAEQHNVRVRIRHAIHGMDDETIAIVERMAKNGLIILELNPDTNLALNNIDDLALIGRTLKICVQKQIPFVLPSDGAGLYQTDAKQIALSALFAGLGAEGFEFMQQTELAHITRQDSVFAEKSETCPPGDLANVVLPPLTYTAEVKARYDEQLNSDRARLEAILKEENVVTDIDTINAAISGKRPIILLGANGHKWDEISEHHQNIQACLAVLATRNSNKFFFMSGRTKDQGIGIELGKVLEGTDHLYLGQLLQAERLVGEMSVTPFTHLLIPDGDFLDVAFKMIDFAKKNNGIVIAVGGGSFTREMIKCASDAEVPVLLMEGPLGASTDKAKITPNAHIFTNAAELQNALASIIMPDGTGTTSHAGSSLGKHMTSIRKHR